MKQTLCFVVFALTRHAEVLLHTNFKSGLQHWRIPDYWNGKLQHTNGMMQMTSTERDGKNFARVLTHCKQLEWGGNWLRVSVKAHGQGELRSGLIKYFPDSQGKIDYTTMQYVYSEPAFVLTETPQSFEYTFKLGEDVPILIATILQIDGTGDAFIASYKIETTCAPEAQMENLNAYQVFPEGAPIGEFRFRFSRANQPALIFHNGQVHKATTDSNGLLTISGLTAQKGLNRITASAEGAIATSYIDTLPQQEWDTFAQAASKIKIFDKIHCLFIGDSLTDFDRGHNCIDKLGFWLDKYNPGQFSVRNAAVRGDFITRVEQRLKGEKAFMQERYDNLFAENYDLIIFWLGHNDTRTNSNTGFSQALVPPQKQEESFHRVIKLIRQSSQAPILLISPSPANAQMLQERAAKQATGRNVILFGKAEHVQAYDQILQKLAVDLKLGYMQITEAFRQHPELPTLFQKDGVHLSEKGHSFVAMQLLAAFAENPLLKQITAEEKH